MGRDTDRLSIINMNGKGRKGRHFWECQKHFLDGIIWDEQPNIVFLPGDDPGPESMAIQNYSQVLEPGQNGTVLLYDHSRLQATKHPMMETLQIEKLDKSKLVCSSINILSPAPSQTVVKSFQALTWQWELMETTSQQIYQNGEQLLMLTQLLASITETEILIGGNLNLEIPQVKTLIKRHNDLVAKGLDFLKPFFRDLGYMDCMTDNVLSPNRRLKQLKLHMSDNITDYFIASKEMQLMQTQTIKLERLEFMKTTLSPPSCRPAVTQVPANKTTCTNETTISPQPTRTEMFIPPRPPKHHGG